MIVLLLVGLGFWQLAKIKGLISFLWAIIGGVSYFLGNFFAILIVAWTSVIFNEGLFLAVGFIGGIVGVLIAWMALEHVSKNKKASGNTDIIDDDDQYLEKF